MMLVLAVRVAGMCPVTVLMLLARLEMFPKCHQRAVTCLKYLRHVISHNLLRSVRALRTDSEFVSTALMLLPVLRFVKVC